MQLTDDEIRQILAEEKRKKRRRMRTRRRVTALIVLIVLLLLIVLAGSTISKKVKSRPKPPAEPLGIIFIDPGHGGNDAGAYTDDRNEKDDTLKLALAMKTSLEEKNFKVVMSREDDTDVDTAERNKMANDSNAQLMISLHRNMRESRKGKGVEAYIPKKDEPESRKLAQNLVNALVEQGFKGRDIVAGTFLDPDKDYDDIADVKMPACKLEVGFITNKGDNDLFDNNLNENAAALAEATYTTFNDLYGSK